MNPTGNSARLAARSIMAHHFSSVLTGALGAAVAYLLFRGIADITSAIVIIGLALSLAIVIKPTWLQARGGTDASLPNST
jgi:hypothetical protein